MAQLNNKDKNNFRKAVAQISTLVFILNGIDAEFSN